MSEHEGVGRMATRLKPSASEGVNARKLSSACAPPVVLSAMRPTR
jgi:hypothetical protein